MINKKQILRQLMENKNIPHRSRYHADSYLEHTLLVIYNASILNNSNIFEAAMLHDILKPETQEFNKRGEPCFYGHEKLTLERASEFGCDNEYVITLVNLHMLPYLNENWAETKTIKNAMEKYGDQIINDVELLHQCDVDGTIRPGSEDSEAYDENTRKMMTAIRIMMDL